jgi:site-specific DNA recombinase
VTGHLRVARQPSEVSRYSAVMDSLAAFSARIEERLHTASIAERQAILQLVVERIVVHDDHIEVEHVIPLHGPDPGPGWRLPQPDRRLRSDGLGRPEYVRIA